MISYFEITRYFVSQTKLFVRQHFKAKHVPLPENEVPSRFLKAVKVC